MQVETSLMTIKSNFNYRFAKFSIILNFFWMEKHKISFNFDLEKILPPFF